MHRYNRQLHRLLAFIVVLVTVTVLSGQAFAAEETHEIVRVGYYDGDESFQSGFSDEERKSGYAYEYYQKLSTLIGWSYEYVYGSRAEILDMLCSGEVDIAAGILPTDRGADQLLFSESDMGLEGSESYFAVTAGRPDLLEQLNLAQEKLHQTSPGFTMELWQKYYSHDNQMQALTEEEKQWLKNIGTLNIGYERDNLPLSDQLEDGTPTGVVKELLATISSYLEIDVNPICYEDLSLMNEALQKGEIDAAFPAYSDLWLTETKGLFQSDALTSDRVMLVYQGSYRSDLLDKIAVSETGEGQRDYINTYYPDSEISYYETRVDAFKAIQKGEVNCMIGSASVLQRFMAEHDEFENFHSAYLDSAMEFGISVNQGESMLVGILNKAIAQMGTAAITSAMIRYSGVEQSYNFMDFIQRYAPIVILVLCVFFGLLLWMFLDFRRKSKRFNAAQKKTLEALEDALGAANAASEAKTTFLSSMSHDIRTPLNGIIGMTAIAAANVDDSARVKDCLTKITASGKHLLALINEVLDMSKIESGEIHLNEEQFNLAALMDDLITLNKPQADAKHHELTVRSLNISHEEVIGDSLRIQQVFTNIVGNAIKYTPEGGHIRITLSEKPSGTPRQGCFEFVVEDNGIGMSQEYLPHLFETFTREDNTATRHAQGTGLGMAITRNIVHMMDGDISVESQLGKGSTFTVTLYLKLRDTKDINYDDFVDLPILVVDDDQVTCESTCMLLDELGMNGEWVLSGQEAVERVEERHKKGTDYFALLLDWKMPDMDGIQTTAEIRRRVGNDVPIIIISAYDWSDVESDALAAGANGFVGKPLFKSRLVHLFDELLGHETEQGEATLREMTEQVNFEGKRVLLAEDNDLNAEIATEFLHMMKLEVEWAKNGKEALEKMQNSAPGYYDCIFMDIQMPIMNGIEAAKAIRAMDSDYAKNIPKIAIASWTPRGKSGVNKTLITDGAAGSVRERGCRSRQAA